MSRNFEETNITDEELAQAACRQAETEWQTANSNFFTMSGRVGQREAVDLLAAAMELLKARRWAASFRD